MFLVRIYRGTEWGVGVEPIGENRRVLQINLGRLGVSLPWPSA